MKRRMHALPEQIYAQLGGKAAIGAEIRSEAELDDLVREGFPVSVLRGFREDWGLTVMELAASLSIPKSTLMRMLEQQRRMASADSDRAYRLASILALAEEYIGDRKSARHWLRQPNQALGNQTPLHALQTAIGARLVEQVLGRIAYGGVS
jgi:putative toxin-antitoxin system antitoxin component (TIGR02293 family)